MTYYVGNMPVGEDELTHYGIKGMRWGQRRFQNRDGSLTAAGRLKYGYGQARQRTSNWYKKNKKTIGRVAKVAGGVALAGAAGYLGYRNRAALRAAGRAFRAGAKKSSSYYKNRMTGKIFPAGTKRAQFRSKVKFQGAGQVFRDSKAGQNFAKAQRKIRNARMTVGGTARSAKNVAGEAFRNSKAGQGFAKVGRKVRNAKTAKRYASNKSVDYIRTKATNSKNRAKVIGASVKSKASSKVPQRVKDAATNVRVRANEARFRRSQRATTRDMNRQAINKVKEIYGTKSTRKAKKLWNEAGFATRRARARAQGKDLVKGKTSDVVRLKGRKAADKVAKTAKTVGGKVKSTAESVKRKRRISKQVTGAFNSPSRYVGTHTPKQAARDVARAIGTRAAATVAGSVGGAYVGNRIERKYSGTSTKKRRKKSRK